MGGQAIPRFGTWVDRAYRREKIVAAYVKGASSRAVAEQFGMTSSYVRWITRQAGVARPSGRPPRKQERGE